MGWSCTSCVKEPGGTHLPSVCTKEIMPTCFPDCPGYISGKVVGDLVFPLFNKGYHMYIDNYYPNLPLFRTLYLRWTPACGTVRANKGYPQGLVNYKTTKKGVSEFTERSVGYEVEGPKRRIYAFLNPQRHLCANPGIKMHHYKQKIIVNQLPVICTSIRFVTAQSGETTSQGGQFQRLNEETVLELQTTLKMVNSDGSSRWAEQQCPKKTEEHAYWSTHPINHMPIYSSKKRTGTRCTRLCSN